MSRAADRRAQGRTIDLRYFGGLGIEEIGSVLDTSLQRCAADRMAKRAATPR